MGWGLELLYEHGHHVLPIYAAGDRVARSSASLEEIKKRGGKKHIDVVPNPGSGVQRMHCLAFTVRKSAEDPTLIGHFQVATGLALSEPMLAPLWAHIRRCMTSIGGWAVSAPSKPSSSASCRLGWRWTHQRQVQMKSSAFSWMPAWARTVKRCAAR